MNTIVTEETDKQAEEDRIRTQLWLPKMVYRQGKTTDE